MACPAAFTYIEFAPSMWNLNFLQSEPRSASELQPVLMNSTFARCTTWAMASPEAEEISPTIAATLSRSTKRSALAEAVCGLTESSIRSSILRPITPPPALISSAPTRAPHPAAAGVDLVGRHLHGHDGVFAERAEKTGPGRQVADADGVGLRPNDRRHADAGEGRQAAGPFQERAAVRIRDKRHGLVFLLWAAVSCDPLAVI